MSAKPLLIAYSLFLIIVILAGLYVIFALISNRVEKEGVLGDYESPRSIPMTRPGVTGPAVTSVGMLLVSGRRCVHASGARVEQFITYRRLPSEDDAANTPPVPDSSYGNLVARAEGCIVQDIILALPPEVTPGRWYLEAIEVALSTGEIRRWTSEPFTVVGR